MKKTLTLSLVALVVALCLSTGAFAQTILTMTTLSNAVNAPSDVPTAGSGLPQCFVVASATGITAPTASYPNTPSASTSGTTLFVDREAMSVTSVSSTTVCAVRGADSTAARSHASGALVFVIPDYLDTYSGTPYGYSPAVPTGSCTRSKELVLPRIQFVSGIISDCVGGQWVNGDALGTTRQSNFELPLPATGATAYTAVGTSTAKATNTMYCTELDLPYSKYITGLAVMNGATATTDKELIALYDSTGNLIANSAVAGTVASGASTYQKRAFTTPYYAVGPAQYFGCVQGDSGTTATLNLLTTGTQDTYLTQSYASQTFGTVPATITVPTTFTTLKGPYFFVY
jgi:hypothetical protein